MNDHRGVFRNFTEAFHNFGHGNVHAVEVADFTFVGFTDVNEGMRDPVASPLCEFVDRDAFHDSVVEDFVFWNLTYPFCHGGGKVVEERVAAKSQTQAFEWNDVVWTDVAQVDVGSELLQEPNLLRLLGSLPKDVLKRHFGQDATNQSGVGRAIGSIDAHIATFPSFCNHFPAARGQLLLHHGRPLVGADEDAGFF